MKTEAASWKPVVQQWCDRHIKLLFLLPAFVVVGGLIVYPLLFTFHLSVTDAAGSVDRESNFIGVENFVSLVTDTERFLPSVWRTLYFTAIGVSVQTVLALAIALLLRKPFRGQTLVRTSVLMPMVATPAAVGVMWLLIFEPTIGVANEIAGWFGIAPQGWISDPSQTMTTLIFVDTWEWTPMMALIMLAGLLALPEEPLEAARVDGASWFQRVIHVTVPMLRPTIFAAVLLRLIESLKTFDLLYTTKGAGGGSSHEAETLEIYSYSTSFDYQEYGLSAASLVLYLVLIIVIIGGFMAWQKRGTK